MMLTLCPEKRLCFSGGYLQYLASSGYRIGKGFMGSGSLKPHAQLKVSVANVLERSDPEIRVRVAVNIF